MLTMQPLMMMAEGKDTTGLYRYRVRFKRDGQEVEYTFVVDNEESPGVTAEDEFIEATFCDPFAPDLYQSILKFHRAYRTEAVAEPRTSKPGANDSKRATA